MPSTTIVMIPTKTASVLANSPDSLKPEAGTCGNEFGSDKRSPAVAETEPQARDDPGQGRRERELKKELAPGEFECTGRFNELGINPRNSRCRIHVDWEKSRKKDDRDFGGFFNPEPQNQKRNQR